MYFVVVRLQLDVLDEGPCKHMALALQVGGANDAALSKDNGQRHALRLRLIKKVPMADVSMRSNCTFGITLSKSNAEAAAVGCLLLLLFAATRVSHNRARGRRSNSYFLTSESQRRSLHLLGSLRLLGCRNG